MRQKYADEIIKTLSNQLLKDRSSGELWRGYLSSSAISTSVSAFALYKYDKEKYQPLIVEATNWLKNTMTKDGLWGDSPESKPNMTATLLSYCFLSAVGAVPQQTKKYLNEKLGGLDDDKIVKGVIDYYGKDLTFSAPILVMCALSGVVKSWDKIPQLPFEVSILPQRLFRFFRLPVVSYAIPALIAVGILRMLKGKSNIFSSVRKLFIKKSLSVLTKLQPDNGGFLEAAPLTAFVCMCMIGAGFKQHITTHKCIEFLTNNIRNNGSWPIDTDLACWVTSLSIKALGDDINCNDKQELASLLKQTIFDQPHPFTGAKEGGWSWTNLPGAVPDADDTAGTLIALHYLLHGEYCNQVGKGIEWLLHIQNSDGGIPTFCKGWGKLPFDRSSPDISAHTLMAFELWKDELPSDLKKNCIKGSNRIIKWMQKTQSSQGTWMPLWFGDQDADNEQSPIYGTAVALEHLSIIESPIAQQMTEKAINYLLSVQNADGGWGGNINLPSKITLTAKVLSALVCNKINNQNTNLAFDFLYAKFRNGELYNAEPIGLYFSRLWYSEKMYNITFVLNAINKYKSLSKYH
jgi:prenyltransferase beta subunit